MASPGLKWQERREAGFTEQRSLPASNGGRITGRCTMGPLGPRDPLKQTTILFSFFFLLPCHFFVPAGMFSFSFHYFQVYWSQHNWTMFSWLCMNSCLAEKINGVSHFDRAQASHLS